MSAAGLNSLTFGSTEMQSVLCDLTFSKNSFSSFLFSKFISLII